MSELTQCPQCGRPVLSKRVDACLYCGASLGPDQGEGGLRGVVRMDEALKAPPAGKGYGPRSFWASLFDWDLLKYVLFGLVLGGVIFTLVMLTMRSAKKVSEKQATVADYAIRQAEEAQRQAYQKQLDTRRAVREAEGMGTPATSARQLAFARSNVENLKEALNAYAERNGHYPPTLSPDAYEIAWLAKTPYDVSSFLNGRIMSYRCYTVSDTLEVFELVAIANDGHQTEIRTMGSFRIAYR